MYFRLNLLPFCSNSKPNITFNIFMYLFCYFLSMLKEFAEVLLQQSNIQSNKTFPLHPLLLCILYMILIVIIIADKRKCTVVLNPI